MLCPFDMKRKRRSILLLTGASFLNFAGTGGNELMSIVIGKILTSLFSLKLSRNYSYDALVLIMLGRLTF